MHLHSLALAPFLVLSFLPAIIGSRFRPGAWFAGLRKPAWNPPSWVFAPVWTLLYATMAIAAWLVWEREGWSGALWLYVVQLVLNGMWTWLFFGLQSPALSSVDIVALWLAIAVTMAAFWQARALAGVLMAPYLGWVSFATVLNLTIWRLNGRP